MSFVLMALSKDYSVYSVTNQFKKESMQTVVALIRGSGLDFTCTDWREPRETLIGTAGFPAEVRTSGTQIARFTTLAHWLGMGA
jgi:hypothetical protein